MASDCMLIASLIGWAEASLAVLAEV